MKNTADILKKNTENQERRRGGSGGISATEQQKSIKSLPKKLQLAVNKASEKIRGILDQILINPAESAIAIAKLPIKYKILVLFVIGLNIESQSQTKSTRGQNELNVAEFHCLTDPSCTALGMDDNQEKLTTHAMLTQDYLNATDTRLIGLAPFCRVNQEPTTAIIGSGNKITDINNLNAYTSNPANNCDTSDIQYFYSGYTPVGYEEYSRIGETANGFCRAVFNGAYDADTYGAHAYGHVSGAVGSAHNEARYDATYTYDLTSVGGGISTMNDGKSIGGMGNYPGGSAYQPFYCTPEAYNKDTPANGGDGYYYYNSLWDAFPAWIATDQMNNNTGYTETSTGIYDFLMANPEKLKEEAVSPPITPVITQIGDNSIGISNESAYNVEYPNTTEASYQATYFTSALDSLYLYDAANSGDGQFIDGPIGLNETFDNLPAGDYVLRTYEWWSNGLSAVSSVITITGPDTTPPIAICQDIDVYLDTNGSATITAEMIDNGSYDNEGGVTLSINISEFDCDDLGANTVILTVTDDAGNISTCTSTVTVYDDLDPTAVAQPSVVELDANGNGVADPNNVNNGSTDNCGIDQMTVNPANFSCSDLGVQSIVFTVTDASGNSDTDNSTVDVQDNLPPNANTQNIVAELDADGNVVIVASQVNNNSTDNCGIDQMTVSPDSFTCSDLGMNTVILTVTDASGNSDTENADVDVQDNLNPEAIGQDLTLNLAGNSSVTTTAAAVDNGSSDNCSVDNMTLSQYTFTEVGTYNVDFTVFDGSGNSDIDQVVITVVDNGDINPPHALCQDAEVELDENGEAEITPEMIDNGSYDDEGEVTLSVNPTSVSCNDLGNITATLTATDGGGNTDQCTSTVTVLDLLNPEAIGKNITIDLKFGNPYIVYPEDVDDGSNDNCSFTLELEPNTFDYIGTYPAVLTATDESGNTDFANIEIEVVNSVGVGETKEIAEFKIYPNPAKSLINIETGESLEEIVIYNSIGQKVIQKEFSNGTNPDSDRITIDISTLPKGIYFLYATGKEGNISTAKVIKN